MKHSGKNNNGQLARAALLTASLHWNTSIATCYASMRFDDIKRRRDK